MTMKDYRTIVVGTDGSALAEPTVGRAAWLAKHDDADLVIVCAYSTLSRRDEAKNVATLGGDSRTGQVLGRTAAGQALSTAVQVAADEGATVTGALLVDGEAVSVVAHGDNLTYQPLARTCNKVMDKVEELRSNAPVLVPPGWEEATIVAPVEFIAETRKRLERYLLDKGWKKSIA